MGDADLVARVLQHDDRRAFATLVRHHQSGVRFFLRRLCREDALADDLAQETFLRAWRHMATYRAEARFKTWLFQIAYNLFLSHVQLKKLPLSDVPGEQAAAHRHTAILLQHDLATALDALGTDERAVFMLCTQQELTHEEASVVLAMPLGTVKTHANRGREKLKSRLRAWHQEGPAP
jgi:RNA polymerase sigma factor (sigma-70 family)